ncbi:hypothetical protein HDU85_001024 [Gaertneriomyces sp. JEL0708]|nr:hypothetical protein HDU85_001024 [Gaertneriomyces sp. JEL0708]
MNLFDGNRPAVERANDMMSFTTNARNRLAYFNDLIVLLDEYIIQKPQEMENLKMELEKQYSAEIETQKSEISSYKMKTQKLEHQVALLQNLETDARKKIQMLQNELLVFQKGAKRPLTMEKWCEIEDEPEEEDKFAVVENYIKMLEEHRCTYDIPQESVDLSIDLVCGISDATELTSIIKRLNHAKGLEVFLRAVTYCCYPELFEGEETRVQKRWKRLIKVLGPCVIPVFASKPSMTHVADDNAKMRLLSNWFKTERNRPAGSRCQFVERQEIWKKFLGHVRLGEKEEAREMIPQIRSKS